MAAHPGQIAALDALLIALHRGGDTEIATAERVVAEAMGLPIPTRPLTLVNRRARREAARDGLRRLKEEAARS